MSRILVTPRSLSRDGHPALDALSQAGYELVMPAPGAIPAEDTLISALPGCVGWLAGVEPVSARALAAADRLRVISRNGSGVDNLPLPQLEARGIAVTRADGANANGVAELALTLLLAGLRHVVPIHEGMRQGGWPRQIGREICDCTIGIVGLGAIGRITARICLALGARVRAHDPFAPGDAVEDPRCERVTLDELVEEVDAITLHAPLPPDGRPLLTATRIARLRPGTVLVNTARAGLIDSEALLHALDEGRVAGYLTDVYNVEPPEPSALTAHPQVTLTSHIGGYTVSSVERATRAAVGNLLRELR